MPFAFSYKADQQAPLVIYIAHEDKTRDQHWRPAAFIGFTPGLRTSGFLTAVGPDEFWSLLLMLSFITPDGGLFATTLQLAATLGLSPAKTRARFQKLVAVRWLEQPIVTSTQRGSGLDGFAPVPGFLPVIEEPIGGPVSAPILQAVPREVIIEHSRRRYAKTRAEVEREIAAMMNWREKVKQEATSSSTTKDDSPEQPELQAELLEIGLLPQQANDLMKRFDALRIRRQLAWLPYRRAKNQAGYLIAAVKDNYAAPRNLQPTPTGDSDSGDGDE